MLKKFILFLSLLLIIPGAANAYKKSLEDLMSLDIEELMDMRVKVATRVPHALKDVPAAVSVITAEDIESSGYLDIWDLLRNEPGISVFELSGNKVGVSVRGFNDMHSSNKLGVFLDGRSIYNPLTQGVWWDTVPVMLEDIERIEIMRGPNSVLYGFNAFSGIINIITKDPKASGIARIKASAGNFSTQQVYGSLSEHVGKLDYRVSYQRDNSRGFGADHGRGYRDSKQIDGVNVRADYALNEHSAIDITAGMKGGESGLRPVNTNDVYLKSNYQTIKYSRVLSDESGVDILLTATDWHMDYRDVAREDYIGYKQYEAELQNNFNLLDSNEIVWGVHYRRSDGKYYLLRDPANYYRSTLYRVFIQDNISITDNISYLSGVELERHSLCRSAWSFRQTAMYNLFKKHYLRATFARAGRTHSLIEYNMFVPLLVKGNPNLHMETIDSYEVGYRANYLDKKMLFDLELFYNEVHNLRRTVFDMTDNMITYANGETAFVKGAESSIKYKPGKNFSTYANYSYIMQDDETDFYDEVEPKHKVNVGFRLGMRSKFLPDYIDVRSGYVDSIRNKNVQVSYLPKIFVDDYFRLDVKMAKMFFSNNLELAVSGLNLLEREHYEFGNELAVGRQFIVTVEMGF